MNQLIKQLINSVKKIKTKNNNITSELEQTIVIMCCDYNESVKKC